MRENKPKISNLDKANPGIDLQNKIAVCKKKNKAVNRYPFNY